MALQFTPPKSFIEPSFWEEVYNRKLNEWKLSQQSVAITARYGLSDGDIPGALRFNKESFSGGTDGLQVNGVLILVNTIEEFKDYDKLASIQADGLRQLDTLLTSSTLTYPSTGSQFTLLAFGDLKQYRFTYWMNNPACVPKLPLVHSMESKQSPSALSAVYGHLLSNAPSSWSMVFVLKDGICMSLSSQPADAQDLVLVVLDQGTGPAMGWSARNLLLTIAHWLHVHGHDEGHVEMIFVRNAVFRNWSGNALMDSVEALVAKDCSLFTRLTFTGLHTFFSSLHTPLQALQVLGWEPNERGKAGPRAADLAARDPTQLVAQATDLNLRLMKWRLWPSLKLEQVQSTKCLLLGAGTLGCAVARVLVGYGVKHVTFVDSGVVSPSNPARQCLFTAQDGAEGHPKALVAARRLQEINPTIAAYGEVMSIPMPGHPFTTANGTNETVRDEEAVTKLDQLIASHDVVFLLTDSREARWFPTLLARLHGKLAITSALGFDSLLVMHHGVQQPAGCYFCNDLTSAGNSATKRALDQQCTITRPGLAMQAGALSVELMVAALHVEEHALPHQIRGSVVDFSQLTLSTPPFASCTACSAGVCNAYSEQGAAFVEHVCRDPEYLQVVSGAQDLIAAVDDMLLGEDDDF